MSYVRFASWGVTWLACTGKTGSCHGRAAADIVDVGAGGHKGRVPRRDANNQPRGAQGTRLPSGWTTMYVARSVDRRLSFSVHARPNEWALAFIDGSDFFFFSLLIVRSFVLGRGLRYTRLGVVQMSHFSFSFALVHCVLCRHVDPRLG